MIATREQGSVVVDLEDVALAWCVRFAGQIMSRTVKGDDPTSRACSMEGEEGEKRFCTWKRARRSLGHQRRL